MMILGCFAISLGSEHISYLEQWEGRCKTHRHARKENRYCFKYVLERSCVLEMNGLIQRVIPKGFRSAVCRSSCWGGSQSTKPPWTHLSPCRACILALSSTEVNQKLSGYFRRTASRVLIILEALAPLWVAYPPHVLQKVNDEDSPPPTFPIQDNSAKISSLCSIDKEHTVVPLLASAKLGSISSKILR